MYRRHVQGRKRQFQRVLSPMSPIAICASASGIIRRARTNSHPQAPRKKKKKTPYLANKRKENVGQSYSHFGAHLKSDMASIRRGLGVINGLCTGLDIGIDAVEVRGRESMEVVQTVERDRVVWR